MNTAPIVFEPIDTGRYIVRFTQSQSELEDVFRLRFRVFNQEMGEGFASSYQTGMDQDQFDAQCKHLVVVEKETGDIIGTYRLQTHSMAEGGEGFYSKELFDLSALPEAVLSDAVEVGRACISTAHRNGRALFALWRGLVEFMHSNNKLYLFGCASLTGNDATLAQDALNYLAYHGYLHDNIRLNPKEPFAFSPAINRITASEQVGGVDLPSLFFSYLKYGGHICSFPACDRGFNTVDFVVLLDLRLVPKRKLQNLLR